MELHREREGVVPISAFVTYDIAGFDADGLKVATMPIRAVCKPEGHEAIAILRERFGEVVMAAEVQRSVPAKIGRYTPATRRTVSARARVLA
jgi:hypothetical protein